MSKVKSNGSEMHVIGKFGAWDSTIVFNVDDVAEMIPLMFTWGVIGYILKFPFLWVKNKFKRKKK